MTKLYRHNGKLCIKLYNKVDFSEWFLSDVSKWHIKLSKWSEFKKKLFQRVLIEEHQNMKELL